MKLYKLSQVIFSTLALSLQDKQKTQNYILSNLHNVIKDTLNKGHLLNPNGIPKLKDNNNDVRADN